MAILNPTGHITAILNPPTGHITCAYYPFPSQVSDHRLKTRGQCPQVPKVNDHDLVIDSVLGRGGGEEKMSIWTSGWLNSSLVKFQKDFNY